MLTVLRDAHRAVEAALAATQMTMSATWYFLIAIMANAIRRPMTAARARLWLDRLTGCIFIGLGIRLATLTRPG